MPADRYLKFILTVIALELLWLGIHAGTSPALAQQKPQPMPVVITDIRLGSAEHPMLPVIVMGGARSLAGMRDVPGVQPLAVQTEIRQPLAVTIGNQPLTVQTGPTPLVVDVLPAKPGLRPGL